jgi:alpha/beta superfamily hydrolase
MTTASAISRTKPKPTNGFVRGLLRSVDLRGPAGKLETVLNEGAPDAPFAALVCHPHPLGGGTMHNKVVYHAMKTLNDPAWGFEWPVLRFNYRGTGLSQGSHDGQAEADDVAAALCWLESEFKRPIVAVGFSFGAAMLLETCCNSPLQRASEPVRALVALGLPLHAEDREYSYPFLSACTLPKFFISGEKDQYAPADQLTHLLAHLTDSAADPSRLRLIPGADHFFTGQLPHMQTALAVWLKEQLV